MWFNGELSKLNSFALPTLTRVTQLSLWKCERNSTMMTFNLTTENVIESVNATLLEYHQQQETFHQSSTTLLQPQHSSQQPNLAPSWLSMGRIQIPLYTTILLLAVTGNALVILTLVQNRRMRTITNVFLLNLAVSDILLGVLCMPFTLIGTLLRDFVFGGLMCKLLPYLQG